MNAIYVLTLTSLGDPPTTIQAVRLPWSWQEIDQWKKTHERRKQARLNAYIPPTASQSRQAVHTSVTFGARRDGPMRIKRRNLTSNIPSILSMHESTLPDDEYSFSLADDDPILMDDVLGDDEALPQRRRRMAAVRLTLMILILTY